MKIKLLCLNLFQFGIIILLIACGGNQAAPSIQAINEINLRRGEIVTCGPADQQLGTVSFATSCSPETKKEFDMAIALLHSFEYDEAEKAFAKIIDKDPGCAMAFWGVAMSNYHQVWLAPPTPAELEKGLKAITIAQSLAPKSGIEADYINAIASFYKDWNSVNHRTRSLNYAKAMEDIYKKKPGDKEASIFYALSLVATADPTDKSYSNQKKAGEILNSIFADVPNHPGIVHYIIHTYDYPELAEMALPAARKYASVAPSSAHAQHMPSHIFTRLGLWDESIQSNLVSTSAARCYAENSGIKGHWDEELHGMDYLVYSYLQKADNVHAKQQVDYLKTIQEVYPVNFKVAYAFAAIPSRYYLENKMWKEASEMKTYQKDFPWQRFPWQKAIIHFTRLLGSANIGDIGSAKEELEILNQIHDTLSSWKDIYSANQVEIQIKTGEAWILFKEGKKNEAMKMMLDATELEDKTGKNPVTPGEVLPARELLADMLLQSNRPAEAFKAYEEDLKKHPNRFNSLYGAALASERSNNKDKAAHYYKQLMTLVNDLQSQRPELEIAKKYLKQL